MKLLLDTCVWGKAKAELEASGHDVVWGGDWERDPGDERILSLAREEGRILITLDKDFGELAILRKIPHHGILRLVSIPARQQATISLVILNQHGAELENGAIITADLKQVRIRPPEEKTG
jgi:predicted nuclease of predicted toxin-antitoxin system